MELLTVQIQIVLNAIITITQMDMTRRAATLLYFLRVGVERLSEGRD